MLYYYADDEMGQSYINVIYDCDWKNGLKEGDAEYTKIDEAGNVIEHFKGTYRNDQYHGIGTWEFLGENFEFQKGKIVFRGLFEDGTIKEGVFYDANHEFINAGENDKDAMMKKYPFPKETVWE